MPSVRPLLAKVLIAGIAGAAAARYMRTTPTHDDQVQRPGTEPNFHVRVERSGGGV
ncbi:hypothetical protein F5Y16DRAFT_354794 [Xylariaceae sp. FL0255]|nr:hypothetical protein F5Y16DRAFT_354794 [Xylariaceae sp. FL0255]